jgi:NLE (NUC135) domain
MEPMEIEELKTHTIQARFVSDTGEEAGPPIDLPVNVDLQQLELICNALLKNVSKIVWFSIPNNANVNSLLG